MNHRNSIEGLRKRLETAQVAIANVDKALDQAPGYSSKLDERAYLSGQIDLLKELIQEGDRA
jgi:hypothetical protein